jgi:predicted nucleic acid-binding protein
MVKLIFDTNILIDYLNGVEQARTELALHTDKAISLITWMEVMDGATSSTEAVIKGFLDKFTSLPLTEDVAILATKLRNHHQITLPTAIVLATAQINSRILVTRNTNDFADLEPGIRTPYQL